jgi:hypothetical protein
MGLFSRRKLKKLAEQAHSNDIAVFRFDGRVLEVSVGDTQVAVQAAGLPWPDEYRIHATALIQLPSRTVGGSASVGVWRNQLCVDCSPSSGYRVSWPIVTAGGRD